MPRRKSNKFLEAKRQIVHQIQTGNWRPGEKFLTNRMITDLYQISYVTAQRLMSELCREGHVERRPTVGTFIPGKPLHYGAVQLIFHSRRHNPGSYGKHLFEALTRQLDAAGIKWQVSDVSEWEDCPPEHYPVLWERDYQGIAAKVGAKYNFALLFNQPPPDGKTGVNTDSISLNFHSAGVLAGQILSEQSSISKVVIITSPAVQAPDTIDSIRGIQTVWPKAESIKLSQEPEVRARMFHRILKSKPDAIFCLHQKVAMDLLRFSEEQKISCPQLVIITYPPFPPMNYPMISVSLDDILRSAMRIIKSRMHGDFSTAAHVRLTPRIYYPGMK